MSESAPLSLEQFLACLKQQGPVSHQIKAAAEFDVSALSELDQRRLAAALRDYAGTKNGPALIMGLPGPLQAVLSFAGVVMPGQDRLAYLRASTRQVVHRLVNHKDQNLLKGYPFERVTKDDWSYYLSHTADLVEPCKSFLNRSESAGGFSDREIGSLVLLNQNLINVFPVRRIDPESAVKLIVSGTTQPFWSGYDFVKFGKEHWRTILEQIVVTSLPKECEGFLANENGEGFSNDELITLAKKNPIVIPWIDPEETKFRDAYDLYLAGNAEALWKQYPFASLKKDEWALLLSNSEIEIPSALSVAINYGVFTVDELCKFAEKNEKVYPFIPLDELDHVTFVSLLLRTDATYLWKHYDFKRLNAHSWERLICERRQEGLVSHVELLIQARGLTGLIVERILQKDDRYLEYLPLELVSRKTQIILLASGNHEDLWDKCDFSVFAKEDWQQLFQRTTRIPPVFGDAVEKGLFTVAQLCEMAINNPAFVKYLPLEKVEPRTCVKLLLSTRSERIVRKYDFTRLGAADWLAWAKGMPKGKLVAHVEDIKHSKGLSRDIASQLIKIDSRYVLHVPFDIVDNRLIVQLLASGNPEELWTRFDFTRFSRDDWVALFKSTNRVPSALRNAVSSGVLSVTDLLHAAYANQKLVWYIPLEGLAPKDAVGLILHFASEYLWENYDLGRLDGKLWVDLITGCKTPIPAKCLARLRKAKGLNTECVDKILKKNPDYYIYVPLELASRCLIVEMLLSGKVEALWRDYPFDLFDEDDWFALLVSPAHPVPETGKKFLSNAGQDLDTDKLNAILVKRKELIAFVNPRDVDPNVAVKFLIENPESELWEKYAFTRFDTEQLAKIVAKADERTDWPRRIVSAFSGESSEFNKEMILKLAAKSPANVVKLLPASRINSEGPKWFASLCKEIANAKSKRAISAVTRRLTLAGDNWQQLDRDCLSELILNIPQSRKYVRWQKWEYRRIGVLLKSDATLWNDMPPGAKFGYFMWKWWPIILLLISIFGYFSYSYFSARVEEARLRYVQARRAGLVSRIEKLDRECQYESLQSAFVELAKSEDSELAKDPRVVAVNEKLQRWLKRRNVAVADFKKLEDIAKRGWSKDDLREAKELLDVLKRSKLLNQDELTTVRNFDAGYASKIEQLRIIELNAGFRKQIESVVSKIPSIGTPDEATELLKQVSEIEKDFNSDVETTSACVDATKKIQDASKKIFQEEIERLESSIVGAKSVADVNSISQRLGEIKSNMAGRSDLLEAANRVGSKVAVRLEMIRAEEEREGVAEVESSIKGCLEKLLKTDDTESFESLVVACRELTQHPYFSTYTNKGSNVYGQLYVEVAKRENGSAQVAEIERAIGDYVSDGVARILDGEAVQVFQKLRGLVDAWLASYAEVMPWLKNRVDLANQKLNEYNRSCEDLVGIINRINSATDYSDLYEALEKIGKEYSGCVECGLIDLTKVPKPSDVKSATTKSGWFTSEQFCDFVGVVKVNPPNSADVIPVITKNIAADCELYCVTFRYDIKNEKWHYALRKIFERTSNGGFRKVNGYDYSKCQGVGLFRCNDSSYVDIDAWVPGMAHGVASHWIASKEPGVWIPEPGYTKKSAFGGMLSVVEWSPHETYLNGMVRAGNAPGCWEERVPCKACSGSGKTSVAKVAWTCSRCEGCGKLRKKLRCEKCAYCNWKGYQWSQPYNCPACKGKGKGYKYHNAKCASCSGDAYRWQVVEGENPVKRIIENLK